MWYVRKTGGKLLIKTRQLTIIVLSTILGLISCNSDSNYNTIKKYFSQPKEITSIFVCYSEYDSPDTAIVSEKIRIEGEDIVYTINYWNCEMSFTCNPKIFKVTKDSIKGMSLLGNDGYIRNMNEIFEVPDHQKTNGIYFQEIHDTINNVFQIKEIPYDYDYHFYMSMNGDNLVIHKDFTFKTKLEFSFFFSKERGLFGFTYIGPGVFKYIKTEN